MTWTRLTDTWCEDEAFEPLSLAARWHYLCMIQFCSRNKKYEGILRLVDARRCSDVDDPAEALGSLIVAGLVENVDGATVRLKRIKEHVPSPELLAKLEQDRARAARYRKHKAGDHSECLPERCAASRDASRRSSRDARDGVGTGMDRQEHPPQPSEEVDRYDEYMETWGEAS